MPRWCQRQLRTATEQRTPSTIPRTLIGRHYLRCREDASECIVVTRNISNDLKPTVCLGAGPSLVTTNQVSSVWERTAERMAHYGAVMSQIPGLMSETGSAAISQRGRFRISAIQRLEATRLLYTTGGSARVREVMPHRLVHAKVPSYAQDIKILSQQEKR